MSNENEAEPIWRCFHCDELFTDRSAAQLHFGISEHDRPACQFDAAHIRWMEAQHRRNVDDDSEALRTVRSLLNEHEGLRRKTEEAGYAKGLADAKKYPKELGLMHISSQAQPVVLTDEQIDNAQEAAYRELVAKGFNGGMGGYQWDRASGRAIEAASIKANGIGQPATEAVRLGEEIKQAIPWITAELVRPDFSQLVDRLVVLKDTTGEEG